MIVRTKNAIHPTRFANHNQSQWYFSRLHVASSTGFFWDKVSSYTRSPAWSTRVFPGMTSLSSRHGIANERTNERINERTSNMPTCKQANLRTNLAKNKNDIPVNQKGGRWELQVMFGFIDFKRWNRCLLKLGMQQTVVDEKLGIKMLKNLGNKMLNQLNLF